MPALSYISIYIFTTKSQIDAAGCIWARKTAVPIPNFSTWQRIPDFSTRLPIESQFFKQNTQNGPKYTPVVPDVYTYIHAYVKGRTLSAFQTTLLMQ
jgi:hypothetical protein